MTTNEIRRKLKENRHVVGEILKHTDNVSVLIERKIFMTVREQIIEVSLNLFSTKGYEKTSISDIVKASNVSRGGFYHHFQSKEEVLAAITDLYMTRFENIIKQSLEKEAKSYDLQFKQVFRSIITYKIGELSGWSELHKLYGFKGNLPIILQISKRFEEYISNIYEDIITKGTAEGIFHCRYGQYFSSLFTRELMLLISEAQKLVKTGETYLTSIENRSAFLEELTQQNLGVEIHLGLKEALIHYIGELEDLK